MEYYVYIYLNPLKPSRVELENICFLYEPFYVGKGKQDRYLQHIKRKGRNYLKNSILKRIEEANLTPIILKLYEGLEDSIACKKEIELIKQIGRIQLNEGTLTNMTIGGDGTAGWIQSEETKRKRVQTILKSNHFTKVIKSEEYKKEMSERWKSFYNSEEGKLIKEKISIRQKENNNMSKIGWKEEFTKKRNETIKNRYPDGIKVSEEVKEKIKNTKLKKYGCKQIPEQTLIKLIKANKKRKGTKNLKKRIEFVLILNSNEEIQISGLTIELESVCKEYNLSKNTLLKHINKKITKEYADSTPGVTSETIGCTLKEKNFNGEIIETKKQTKKSNGGKGRHKSYIIEDCITNTKIELIGETEYLNFIKENKLSIRLINKFLNSNEEITLENCQSSFITENIKNTLNKKYYKTWKKN